MPTTPNYALRYPLEADTADVPRDMGYLAGDADGALHTHATAATLDHPNGSVTTAKLAANAATQAATSSLLADATTTSTSMQDTGLAATFTTTGGPVLVVATITGQNDTGGDTWEARLHAGGSGGVDAGDSDNFLFQSTEDTRTLTFLFTGLAAGLYGFGLQFRVVAAGTARVLGARCSISAVELKR